MQLSQDARELNEDGLLTMLKAAGVPELAASILKGNYMCMSLPPLTPSVEGQLLGCSGPCYRVIFIRHCINNLYHILCKYSCSLFIVLIGM